MYTAEEGGRRHVSLPFSIWLCGNTVAQSTVEVGADSATDPTPRGVAFSESKDKQPNVATFGDGDRAATPFRVAQCAASPVER